LSINYFHFWCQNLRRVGAEQALGDAEAQEALEQKVHKPTAILVAQSMWP